MRPFVAPVRGDRRAVRTAATPRRPDRALRPGPGPTKTGASTTGHSRGCGWFARSRRPAPPTPPGSVAPAVGTRGTPPRTSDCHSPLHQSRDDLLSHADRRTRTSIVGVSAAVTIGASPRGCAPPGMSPTRLETANPRRLVEGHVSLSPLLVAEQSRHDRLPRASGRRDRSAATRAMAPAAAAFCNSPLTPCGVCVAPSQPRATAAAARSAAMVVSPWPSRPRRQPARTAAR